MFGCWQCFRKINVSTIYSSCRILGFSNKVLKCNRPIEDLNSLPALYFPLKSMAFVEQYCVNFFSTSSIHCKKKNKKLRKDGPENLVETFEDDLEKELKNLEDEKYNTLMLRASGGIMDVSHFAVLQPWIKWGSEKRRDTTPQLMLDEACGLIASLPSATITYKESVPLQVMKRSFVFGSGNLERLTAEITRSNAQAVFISVDHLTRIQKKALEDEFKLRVFDRYIVVLTIFKHYAKSAEARLQIAIAELPFMNKYILNDREKVVLDSRITRLKDTIKRLAGRREKVRKTRQKSSLSSVAIVGYTNCGKTTLIRALTGDKRAEGENRLFATLDVTAHKGSLPCGLDVLFIDTVGFIQDIPTDLIASFNATLQDAIHADVVVHVRDISHPDIVVQTKTVMETLKQISLPKSTPIILVNNKTDLLTEKINCNPEMKDNSVYKEGSYISAVSGEGLNEMISVVEKELLLVTGRKRYHMKLPTGSPKIEWLKENVGIEKEEINEENPQNTLLQVVMNEAEKAAFRRSFST